MSQFRRLQPYRRRPVRTPQARSGERGNAMAKRPGGEMATRPLHFMWIADCSGSMSVSGKIDSLNKAIGDALPHMQQIAADNPHAKVLVRAAAFSHGAKWHVSDPTSIENFVWSDLVADPVPK